MTMSTSSSTRDALRLKLNQETARMPWEELQRFFAAGLVVLVDDRLDLIDVAVAFTNDDMTTVQSWMTHGHVTKANDAHAAQWVERNAALWAIVVRPWILVQQEKPAAVSTPPESTLH